MREVSGELQYLSDSLIVEELFSLEFGLTKQAGVMDMLGGVAGAIKDQVKSQVSSDGPGGIAGGIINLMSPAILFRIHPIIGVLYLIGTSFGLNITTIFSKIVNLLKPKLESGQPISPDEVNSIGKNVVSAEVGSIEAQASGYSHDMLEHLREIDLNQFKIKKTSQDMSSLLSSLTGLHNSQRQTIPTKIPWFVGDSGSPIQKIFGDLFASRSTGKAKWLLGGFVIWIIKTILAGAGLLAVTGAISNYLGHKNNPTTPTTTPIKDNPTGTASVTTGDPSQSESNVVPTSAINHQTSTGLTPSGRGEQVFPNDDQHLWVIPLVNGNVANTLLAWATDVYPDLHGREREITQTPAFQRVTTMLQQNHRSSSPNSIAMPKAFNNRKQVVDLLIRNLTSNQ